MELPALPAFRPVSGNPIDEWFPHHFRAMAATSPVLLGHCRATRPDLADLRAAVDRVAEDGTIRRNLDRMRAAIADAGGAQRAADVILSRALRGA